MSRGAIFFGVLTVVLAFGAQAADRLPSLSFYHHDWELSCDNTRTCRAAGYQSDEDELTVSVLLTRRAGPNEPVVAELMIGNYDNEALFERLPSVLNLAMQINGQGLGKVKVGNDPKGRGDDLLRTRLSAKQTKALLAALPRTSRIEWTLGEHRWRLSDKGAAAVLLKMDEFQGRVGTPGALAKKGEANESQVLSPLPLPVVIAPLPVKERPGDSAWVTSQTPSLWKALRGTVSADESGDKECPKFDDEESKAESLFVTRLSDSKLLVSAPCWGAAYNFGAAYWVINDKTPYNPVLVTTSGSGYSDGVISSGQKGRGLGDCWSSEAWTWDGKGFVYTESSSTGMCKAIAPGGAWFLPLLTTKTCRSPGCR